MIELLTRVTTAFGFASPNQARIPQLQTIRILMKSGNQITLDRVAECDWGLTGTKVTRLHVSQRQDAKVRLHVSTIDLGQIEAILSIKA